MKMLSGARSYVKLSEFGHFWCLRYSEHSILQCLPHQEVRGKEEKSGKCVLPKNIREKSGNSTTARD